MEPSQLIAYLNALRIGDLDRIRARLDEAQRACADLDEPELVETLGEAREALDRLDLKTYRKRIETAVAKLGHLR